MIKKLYNYLFFDTDQGARCKPYPDDMMQIDYPNMDLAKKIIARRKLSIRQGCFFSSFSLLLFILFFLFKIYTLTIIFSFIFLLLLSKTVLDILRPLPGLLCSKCRGKMTVEKKYVSGSVSIFMICRACSRYIDTGLDALK